MLLIPAQEFRDRILAAVGPDWTAPRFPRMLRSNRLFVPHKDFLLREWRKFWNAYRRARNLTYFNKGICELITATAVNEFNWTVNKQAAIAGLGDIAGAMIEARLTIPPGYHLNRVTDSSHSTALVGLTADEKTWDLYFWEPQEEPTRETELELCTQALGAGVSIYDALL